MKVLGNTPNIRRLDSQVKNICANNMTEKFSNEYCTEEVSRLTDLHKIFLFLWIKLKLYDLPALFSMLESSYASKFLSVLDPKRSHIDKFRNVG